MQPPGQLGEEARHGLPDDVAGAENETPTPKERRPVDKVAPKGKLDDGPKQGAAGEYKKATYRTHRGFIRQDR
jgi:hypothetical protein